MRGGTTLVEVMERAGTRPRADGLLFFDLGSARPIRKETFEAALLELAGEAGDLAKRIAAGAYRDNTDALRGDLIEFVRPLNAAALAAEVTLQEAAGYNINEYRRSRWPTQPRFPQSRMRACTLTNSYPAGCGY